GLAERAEERADETQRDGEDEDGHHRRVLPASPEKAGARPRSSCRRPARARGLLRGMPSVDGPSSLVARGPNPSCVLTPIGVNVPGGPTARPRPDGAGGEPFAHPLAGPARRHGPVTIPPL